MGLRLSMRVYQAADAATFRSLLEQAATRMGGQILWRDSTSSEQDLRYHLGQQVHTLTVPYHPRIEEFSEHLGDLTQKPWLRLRLQEGSLWDYELVEGDVSLDLFSTLPEYWDYPDVNPATIAEWQGKPEVLARAFHLPVEAIDRYLLHWGYQEVSEEDGYTHVRQGKAYPEDEAEYGDCYQIFDFLRRLGGSEPLECATLKLLKQK
jgi:hypothetical protein